MRGLIAKPSGEIIESPITSNFKEGLTALEYFNSTHGARKGLADTALKTASSGYLTRRLCDVAQDLTVTKKECDCKNPGFIELSEILEGGNVVVSLSERALGRVTFDDVKHPITGEIIIKKLTMIDEAGCDKIDSAGIKSVKVYSVMTCGSKEGVCATSYGRDLSRGKMVHVGEAIGMISAQSIGEPGTQLTMRTFHVGGTAQIKEESSVIAHSTGTIKIINKNVIENSVKVAKQFCFFTWPFFDKDEYLSQFDLIPFYSTWDGHSTQITVKQFFDLCREYQEEIPPQKMAEILRDYADRLDG